MKAGLADNQPGRGADPLCDPSQMIGAKGNAALGWMARFAPTVDENRRAFAGGCLWPIPICGEHQIIQTVAPAHFFMAGFERRAHQMIVAGVIRGIAPQVADADFGAIQRRHPVRSIIEFRDLMGANRRAAVAFALVGNNASLADGTGEPASHEPRTPPGDDQIAWGRLHSKCPDFFALVAR